MFDLNSMPQRAAREQSAGHKQEKSHAPGVALSLSYLKSHYKKVNSIRELISGPPAPGQLIFLSTVKSFNAFTFIPYLLKYHPQIDELYLSTFAINQRVLSSFVKLVGKGAIKQVNILASESIIKRLPKVYNQLQYWQKNKPQFTVRYAWNHSKITLARCGQNYYCIEGSGNWSENAALEQYLFTNSAELFHFRKQHIVDLVR